MTRADELNALASKVEALDGPDRGVDSRIDVALFPQAHATASLMRGFQTPFWRWLDRTPPYTRSLDAAISLYADPPEMIPSNPRKATALALRKLAECTG